METEDDRKARLLKNKSIDNQRNIFILIILFLFCMLPVVDKMTNPDSVGFDLTFKK